MTFPRTSRRLAFAAAAVLIGLSACGDDAVRSTAPAKSPVVIHLGDAPTGGSQEAAGAPAADRMMMPFQNITYVWAGGASDLGANGPAWTFPTGAVPDEARVRAIADVLGVEGDIRALPADQGGGWMVGAADYSTANLTVSADGMLSWWFNPEPSTATGGGCAVSSPASDPAVDSVGGGEAPSEEVVCEEPQPPAGIPTANEAEAAARELFDALGYDADSLEYDVYADEWSAGVSAFLMLDGVRSPLGMYVGFGENGAVNWVSAFLATPQPSADYPLVSIEAAIERLNEQRFAWLAGDGMARAAETTTAGGDVDDSALVDPPACDALTPECGWPEEAPEEVTVTLTAVRLDTTMVWDADGTVWLLPAYTFSDADGGTYTVLAVDDSFLQVPEDEPAPMPEPAPGETVVVEPAPGEEPGEPAPVEVAQADAEAVLIGLTLDEAAKVAEERGWEVRPVVIDGESQAVTDDLRTARVNVVIEDGVVTAVDGIY